MRVQSIDGLPVINARRPIWLQVKQSDISRAEKSNRQEPAYCAIARAVRRVHHVKEVRVHLTRIYVRFSDDHWVRYETPSNLKIEIVCFDRGGRFSPGEFRLPAPRPSARASGKRQGTATNENVKKRKRRAYHAIRDVRGGPAN